MAKLYHILIFLCTLQLLLNIPVYAQDCQVAVTAGGPTTLCPEQPITLTATTTNAGATYQWQKDGAAIAGQTSKTLTVTSPGEYTVTVKGTACQEKTSPKLTITAGTTPIADFSFASNDCSGNSLKFTGAPSGPGLTYEWTFGDPASGSSNINTGQQPTHTFSGNGVAKYQVTLKVTNEGGCTGQITKEVSLNQQLDASLADLVAEQNFSVPFTNCSPVAANYVLKVSNKSSTKSINQSYTIKWGDGKTETFPASFQEAQHTYTTQGAFDLLVTVTGPNGCTATKKIQVFNGSNPSISVGNPGNTVGCAPIAYTFPITGVANNSPSTTYTFQFDDGSAPYKFTQADVPAAITHTFVKTSCNNTTSNGTPSNSFSLTASASNPCGTTNVTVSSIRIAATPKALFEIEPQTPIGCLDTDYTLNNLSITGANMFNNSTCNSDAVYQWDITPATGWTLTSGSLTSMSPVIKFSEKGAYSITLKVINSCNTAVITKNFSIIDKPVAKFTTNLNPTSLCKNLEVTTTNQSIGDPLTYVWVVSPDTGYTVISGSLTSKDPVFRFSLSGLYTLTLKATNQCATSTSSTKITVKAPPTVTLPGPKTYCGPQQLAFTDNNAAHGPTYAPNMGTITAYKWVVTGGATFAGSSTEASQYPVISFPVAGSYTVTLTATNECGVSEVASQVVTITAPVNNNTISSPQTICGGMAPSKLIGSTPESNSPGAVFAYTWEQSTTSATAPDFTLITGAQDKDYAPGNLTKTTWFRRLVSMGGCINTSEAIMIKVDPMPDALSSANQIICEGSSAVLTINAAGNCQWFDQPTGGNVLGTSNSFTTPVLTASTTFYVQVLNNNGCPSPRTAIEVTVHKAIASNVVSGDQALCGGATPTTLTGSVPTGGDGRYTYLWESSTTGPKQGFTPAQGDNTRGDYSPTGITATTWFRRRVTAGPCEANVSEAVKISVTPALANNQISIAQSICAENLPAPLTGSQPQGGDGTFEYVWESSTLGPTTGFAPAAGNAQGKNYQAPSLSQTTWFRRRVLSAGCSHTSPTVQITVVPAIANNTITASQTLCRGDAAQPLTGSIPTGGDGAYTFLWESSTDGISYQPAPGANKARDYTPTQVTKDTWFRRAVSSGPCAAMNSKPVQITVITPITNNLIQKNQEVCTGVPVATLQGSVPSGGGPNMIYRWEVSTSGPAGPFSPATGNNAGLSYEPGGLQKTSWFRRAAIAPPCLVQPSNVVQITVFPLPAPPTLASGSLRICPGEKTILTVSNPSAAVEWYDQPTGGRLLTTGISYVTPALTQTTTYYAQSFSTEGCPSLQRTAIKVEVVPPLANAGPDVTIIQGRSVKLEATGGVKYSWVPSTGLSSATTAAPTATPQETITYTVTVTSPEGCYSQDEVTVTVLPQVFIPNVLTLNKDGINDHWEILNIEKYPNCKVEVFNRWGAKVFSSQGYSTKWDGTYQGKTLPVAAYFYVIYLGNNEEPISGSITIIN
ncbi:T9SS C-terminal target domain-containing protein [Rufibacter radiotolerans]|uniref:T9SS C-terminal target domain-containing protein n=1 Tax=Rufibacter radiotolerans TaxID=1379910 RepID=UPI0006645708|nr:T9SS C-terminal target domain-containing protein [Rufibacter radiotolerans]